jgi:hypothetical protein
MGTQEKSILTTQSAFQKFFAACSEPKPEMTPEEFGRLPEEKQLSILNTAAALNPGFWTENVVGISPRIRNHKPGYMTIAEVPKVRIATSDGEISI